MSIKTNSDTLKMEAAPFFDTSEQTHYTTGFKYAEDNYVRLTALLARECA
jgi:hypothetical protein